MVNFKINQGMNKKNYVCEMLSISLNILGDIYQQTEAFEEVERPHDRVLGAQMDLFCKHATKGQPQTQLQHHHCQYCIVTSLPFEYRQPGLLCTPQNFKQTSTF
jgi:hypothetical protein